MAFDPIYRAIGMRTLCLFIPHFPVQVEGRESSIPVDEPVIIGGLPHERKAVHDASPQAMKCGVKIGMSLRHAYSLCPGARFIPADEKKYELAFEEVLDVLDGFSPVVEGQGLGVGFLDASGLGKHYDGEENLAGQLLSRVRCGYSLAASVAVADNKFVARTAAVLAGPDGFTLVPEGNGKAFLALLHVDVLPCSEEVKRRLHLLGIKTVGEVVELGCQAMLEQFGEEGAFLHRLACGIDESPLLRRPKPDLIEQTLDFDSPVDTLDELLSGIGKAVESLSARLKTRWQLCQRVELVLRFDDGKCEKELLNLGKPTRSGKSLLSLLRLRLERACFERPVCGVSLTLSRFCRDGKQVDLPVGVVGRRRQIASAAKEIRSRAGRNVLKRPVVVDHEASLPEQGFILRDLEI